jgi:uncharacterized protein (TIGR02300 family)
MSRPELGNKRRCLSCETRFYDLRRDPIHCPKCDVLFVVPPSTASRAASARASKARTARAQYSAAASADMARSTWTPEIRSKAARDDDDAHKDGTDEVDTAEEEEPDVELLDPDAVDDEPEQDEKAEASH